MSPSLYSIEIQFDPNMHAVTDTSVWFPFFRISLIISKYEQVTKLKNPGRWRHYVNFGSCIESRCGWLDQVEPSTHSMKKDILMNPKGTISLSLSIPVFWLPSRDRQLSISAPPYLKSRSLIKRR